jgi:hypothetical protein
MKKLVPLLWKVVKAIMRLYRRNKAGQTIRYSSSHFTLNVWGIKINARRHEVTLPILDRRS